MFLLCTTLSLVIGLYFLRNNSILSVIIAIIYLIFIIVRFGKKKFLICLILFGCGAIAPRISLPENTTEFSGVVIEVRDNYVIFESKLHKYYVSCKENEFEMGDILKVQGELHDLTFTSYESQFDFQDYLSNKGIKKELYISNYEYEYKSFIKIHKFQKEFLSKFDENTATLISAFLFNQKDYSSDVIKHADSSGILYMLSLSGVYLNVMFAALTYVLFLKFKKKTSKILPFIILLPFAFFSFTKIGTIRVYSLYLLKYLNEFHFKKRKFIHIELVSLLALFFVIIDYNLVYQQAFYIGFLLSLFSPLIHNALKCFGKKKGRVLYPLTLKLSFIPILINNGTLDLFIILKTIIIFPTNLLFLTFTIISTFVPIYGVTEKVGGALTKTIEILDLVNTKVPCGNWGGMFSVIFYLIFFLLIYLLEAVRKNHSKIALSILLAFITISILPLQEPISNAVYFVNVGQGDSIIIKNKTHTVMIDTGGNIKFDMATETLIPFMNKKKINHIDALITTHDDFDHSGAKDSLVDNFKVKNYLSKPSDFPYKVGDIELINLNNFNYTEDNDKSLVLYMNFIGKDFMFMGDASTIVEKAILKNYTNLNCDILKVGHHGSKTSTSEEFIKALKPTEGIVSVGAKNYYGHPNKEVIDLLTKYNVKIRRTDEEGTISYFSIFA